MEELLKTALLRGCGPFDELRLQGIIRRVFGWGEEEVSYLCNDFWLKRGHNIVEHGPLLCDVSGGKLGLSLSEPDMWVSRPEWRELDAYSRNVSAGGVAFHQGWAIFFDICRFHGSRQDHQLSGRGALWRNYRANTVGH